MKPNRIAIYARVSTDDQKADLQLDDLRRYAEARGMTIYREYVDGGVSGVKDSRPALNALMDDARKRKFDVVCVWKFDRFARSTRHLLSALDEFKNVGIDFISYSENIDTSTPLGKAVFTIVAAIGELERSLIMERVKAGMKAAKMRGRHCGRPRAQVDLSLVKKLRSEGKPLREVASIVGASHVTLSRLLNAA